MSNPIKKIVLTLFNLMLCFSLFGCRLNSKNNSADSSENTKISSNAYHMVYSQEDICSQLLYTMENNDTKSYFCVTDKNMIDVDSWINKLNGIENIHCEYKRIKEGYNVVVNLNYWDNYSIVYAYKTGNTNKLSTKQMELYQKYCQILQQITSKNATDWDNELAIHDYLVSNIRYETGDDTIYNAYDALINGTSVCNGYAECFKTFMDMLGIDCLAISGSAGGELHIWNLVKLDNEWYHVDVTWDDPINGDSHIDHTYFNITDEDMVKDHNWETTLYPVAKGNIYTYPAIKPLPYINSEEELYSYLLNTLNNKERYVEFYTNTSYDLKPIFEKCAISVTYSYHNSKYKNYTLYRIEFSY